MYLFRYLLKMKQDYISYLDFDRNYKDDEDWNGDPAESTLYLMHSAPQVILPRPNRSTDHEKSPEPQRFSRYSDPISPKYLEEDSFRKPKPTESSNITKYLEKPIAKYSDNKYLERQKSLEREKHLIREKSFVKEKLDRQKSSDKQEKYFDQSFGRDKYQERGFERFEVLEDSKKKEGKPMKYFDDDGFDENIRYRSQSAEFERPRRYSYENEFEEDSRRFKEQPVPKTRQKFSSEEGSGSKYYKDRSYDKRYEDSRYYEVESKPRPKSQIDKYSSKYSERDDKSHRPQEYFEEVTLRRQAQYRQRSPSPEEKVSPRDRFKDAKEKFLLMERERIEMERHRPEQPISPVKEKSFVKRHESMAYPNSKDRYDDRYFDERKVEESRPKPAPRNLPEEVRYRRNVPLERYQNDKYDPKRRSMFSLIEEEHRKNSNEIAKELKRRSYMENSNYEEDFRDIRERERERHFQDLPESDRYPPEPDQISDLKYDQKFQKNQKIKNSAGYRHSYAEPPKMRLDKNGKKHFAEMLHRTNSSVSNNGRVGIASVHPY